MILHVISLPLFRLEVAIANFISSCLAMASSSTDNFRNIGGFICGFKTTLQSNGPVNNYWIDIYIIKEIKFG